MDPREQELQRFRDAVDRKSEQARDAAECMRDSRAGGAGTTGRKTDDKRNQ